MYAANGHVTVYHLLRARRALSYSMMFRWEPEGRYRWTKSMAIAPFWFSTEHCWTALMPFWFSTEYCWTALTPFWLSAIWYLCGFYFMHAVCHAKRGKLLAALWLLYGVCISVEAGSVHWFVAWFIQWIGSMSVSFPNVLIYRVEKMELGAGWSAALTKFPLIINLYYTKGLVTLRVIIGYGGLRQAIASECNWM